MINDGYRMSDNILPSIALPPHILSKSYKTGIKIDIMWFKAHNLAIC